MEIEPHPKDITQGSKTSLRLRVVELLKTRTGYELRTKEVFDGQSQNGEPKLTNGHSGEPGDAAIGTHVNVVVEGIWAQCHIVLNSLIHLVQPTYDKKTDSYRVDNTSGLLVLEPDNLLTCTAVSTTLWCERKVWLNHVFSGLVGGNRAMLVGTLVHEVFQHGLKNKIVDLGILTKFLDEQLDDASIMLEIYSIEMHIKDIRNEAISYLPSVVEWIEKYMLLGPAHALINDGETEVKITEIKDIEENVWSTKYGLKGKVDVTGLVRVHDKRTRTTQNKILPLELKTGNPKLSASHEAQVSLYSMMLEDRYAEYNQGLVIYLKNAAAMHNVVLNHKIKRDLVQRRNQLNYYMKSYYFGPEFLNSRRTCANCERQTECILISNIYEHDISNYSCMAELQKSATGHLDGKFISFFQKYHEKLVAMMTRDQLQTNTPDNGDAKTLGSFWTYTSAEAEARGAGFGKLQASVVPNPKGPCEIRFTRHPDHKENIVDNDDDISNKSSQGPPSAKKQKMIMDYFKPTKTNKIRYKPFRTDLANFHRHRIAVSRDDESSSMDSQNSSTALAIGFMQEMGENSFQVKVYEGALDFIKPHHMYRVDRIEKKTNPDIERLVLVRLLARDDPRCDRVRQLLLDADYKQDENLDLSLYVTPKNFEELNELQANIREHVVGAVCTNNYYIITEQMISNRGTIHNAMAVLTRLLCNLNRTVLIVAQNIDHLYDLMTKLQRNGRYILIDDGKSIKARYQFASNLVKVPQDEGMSLDRKFDSYIRQHEKAPVVITTYAMAIGGLLFTRRTFDYCIAYDCSKTELLLGLSPMFCSDRHILIDVKGSCEEAKLANGDDISLGDHLRKLHSQPPAPVTMIEIDNHDDDDDDDAC